MAVYDKQIYTSYLVKGNLQDAVAYLKKFSDQEDLVMEYQRVFEHNEPFVRGTNTVIMDLDQIYQEYYKAVFWRAECLEKANETLFRSLCKFCDTYYENEKLDRIEKTDKIEDHIERIEVVIKKIVNREGFLYLGGQTSGYFGPYIWERSTKETYDVELPSGIEQYSVMMMDGFISRSWLDFLSFGKVGTGGWAENDGTICCIRSLYDSNSDNFKISFLKHEAQHSYDKRIFKNISSSELEYRAKLVELMYWEDDKIIKMLHLEAEGTDDKNAHATASHRIIADLSSKLFRTHFENDVNQFVNRLTETRLAARELLAEDTERLNSFEMNKE